MNLLSRFTRLYRDTSRRARGPAALSLERLEERWTPAVGVVLDSDSHVTITDDDSGKTSNKIEIIDDLNDHNTYIRVNNGSKALLNIRAGADGLLQNLTINMGSGADKVIFTTVGDGFLEDDLEREIELGLGNDQLELHLADPKFDQLDLGDESLLYEVSDAGGNDSYRVTGGATNGALEIDVFDAAGRDGYDYRFGDLTFLDAHFNIRDEGTASGLQKVAFDHGNVTGDTLISVEYVFTGATDNAVAIGGDAIVHDSAINFSLTTGDGDDTVTFRDNQLDGASQLVALDLRGGKDVVKAKLNGIGSTNAAALIDGSELTLIASLGDGDDAFRATYEGDRFRVSSAGQTSAEVTIGVSGGAGDDSLALRNDKRKNFGLIDEAAEIEVSLLGDAGDDVIDVDLGDLSSASAGLKVLEVILDGDEGADKVKLQGTLSNTTNLTLQMEIRLGADADKDVFSSSVRSAAGATLEPTIDPESTVNGDVDDQFKYAGTVFGQRLDVFLGVS